MVRVIFAIILGIAVAACSSSGHPPEYYEGLDEGGIGNSSGGGSGNPPAGMKLTCEEARFVKLLNLYRQSKGMNTITVSKNGVTSARWHANDMGEKGYFAHTEPNGRDFIARAQFFGFGAWSENAAAGVYTGNDAFCLWKNSAGHNSNMLGNHGSIGIGMAIVGGSQWGAYWSNCFGPTAPDLISEPLTDEVGCTMPSTLPGC